MTEVNLYEWLDGLIVKKGFNRGYNLNDIGKRLEKLIDYVFSAIKE